MQRSARRMIHRRSRPATRTREMNCTVVDQALGYIGCAQLAAGGRSPQVKASCRTASTPPRARRPPLLALDAVACWAQPQTSAARRAPRGGRGAAVAATPRWCTPSPRLLAGTRSLGS
eukprot:scaffold30156_cov65-Phaeocystis_antarctica.AAC.9